MEALNLDDFETTFHETQPPSFATFPPLIPFFEAIESDDPSRALKILELASFSPQLLNERSGEEGLTPLYIATKKGYLQVVEKLVSLGADVNISRGIQDDLPIFAAVQRGDEKMTQFLVDCGSNLNKLDKNSNSVLMLATFLGNVSIVKSLLKGGADPQLKPNVGFFLFSAMDIAMNEGNKELIELFEGHLKTSKL